MPPRVVDARLDHVRGRNAVLVEMGVTERAPDIMQCPGCHAGALSSRGLAFVQPLKPALDDARPNTCPSALGVAQPRQRSTCQRHLIVAAVLGTGGWQGEQRPVAVDLLPRHIADLVATLPGKIRA